jgi:hypothetical protein
MQQTNPPVLSKYDPLCCQKLRTFAGKLLADTEAKLLDLDQVSVVSSSSCEEEDDAQAIRKERKKLVTRVMFFVTKCEGLFKQANKLVEFKGMLDKRRAAAKDALEQEEDEGFHGNEEKVQQQQEEEEEEEEEIQEEEEEEEEEQQQQVQQNPSYEIKSTPKCAVVEICLGRNKNVSMDDIGVAMRTESLLEVNGPNADGTVWTQEFSIPRSTFIIERTQYSIDRSRNKLVISVPKRHQFQQTPRYQTLRTPTARQRYYQQRHPYYHGSPFAGFGGFQRRSPAQFAW